MRFLLVSLEYKSEWLKQFKTHWSQWSVEIRMCLSYYVFLGAESMAQKTGCVGEEEL